jgi:hypothetical protein
MSVNDSGLVFTKRMRALTLSNIMFIQSEKGPSLMQTRFFVTLPIL